MKYFYVEPEVAGGLGERSLLDRSVHPPIVNRLHYKLEGWLGDVILESFPAFVVTDAAKKALINGGVSGVAFGDVEVTVTEQFKEMYPGKLLPSFVWMRPVGKPGKDDVGVVNDGRLVVSQKALDVLNHLGMSHALVESFNA